MVSMVTGVSGGSGQCCESGGYSRTQRGDRMWDKAYLDLVWSQMGLKRAKTEADKERSQTNALRV